MEIEDRTMRRGNGGFTLLELVLVMVIFCLVMAWVAPNLRGLWAGRQTKDAAEQILVLTRWASGQAAADSEVYRLNIDAEARTYSVTHQDGEEFVAVASEFGQTFTLPEGRKLALQRTDGQSLSYIDFYPDGRSEMATIIVSGSGDEQIEIVCPSPTEGYRIQ